MEGKTCLQFSQILLLGPTLKSSSISQQASAEDQVSSLACGNTVDTNLSILSDPHTSRGDGVMVLVPTPEQRAQASLPAPLFTGLMTSHQPLTLCHL